MIKPSIAAYLGKILTEPDFILVYFLMTHVPKKNKGPHMAKKIKMML